jgi:hypothetical protein
MVAPRRPIETSDVGWTISSATIPAHSLSQQQTAVMVSAGGGCMPHSTQAQAATASPTSRSRAKAINVMRAEWRVLCMTSNVTGE